MDAQEAGGKFKMADMLFKQQRYEEALGMLDELNRSYPNNVSVLYPRALCLAHLGRQAEAAVVCDFLIGNFQDARAQTLRAKLQVPAAGGTDDMGIDMNMLDNFLEPKPKKQAAAQRAASESNSKKYVIAGIVVLVVAALAGGAYVYKPWEKIGSAAAPALPPATTVEGVEAHLTYLWGKLKSFSAAANVSVNVPAGKMKVDMNGTGTLEFVRTKADPKFRADLNMKMNMGGMGMDQKILLVSDGSVVYNEMNVMGQQMVMKMDKSELGMGAAVGSASMADFFKQLNENADITLLPEEIVDGKSAFALELSPKGDAPAPGMPVGKAKVILAKDNGLPLKFSVQDDKGAPIMTVSFSNVVANPSISGDRFKYTPPAGAQVMSMDQMKGMVPGMK